MERPDKRQAIVDAMREVVAEYGFHGAPMSLVAERAAVGAGTIYRYFADKEAVIAACYQDLEARCYAAVREGYPEGGPVRERFLHLAKAVVHFFLRAPQDLRFLQQFHDSPYGAHVRRERIFGHGEKDLVRALFEEGRGQKIFKDLPLSALFALAFGPLANICRDSASGVVDLDDPLITALAEACWDGLKK